MSLSLPSRRLGDEIRNVDWGSWERTLQIAEADAPFINLAFFPSAHRVLTTKGGRRIEWKKFLKLFNDQSLWASAFINVGGARLSLRQLHDDPALWQVDVGIITKAPDRHLGSKALYKCADGLWGIREKELLIGKRRLDTGEEVRRFCFAEVGCLSQEFDVVMDRLRKAAVQRGIDMQDVLLVVPYSQGKTLKGATMWFPEGPPRAILMSPKAWAAAQRKFLVDPEDRTADPDIYGIDGKHFTVRQATWEV
jgi:hypothetical protein